MESSVWFRVAVFPNQLIPNMAVVGNPNTCMVVSPIDVTAQSSISIVGAEYVPSRDVVVRVC